MFSKILASAGSGAYKFNWSKQGCLGKNDLLN
jgi:hypothetical protein